ncbi:hypothetical protein CY652_02235 [Burkholderia sp. WAC0059]|uniref:hypothetical protein n=1 Tax=Burkholderia sp. WAC0059 TaxID=2066022 RepID=UPI000C7EEB18|nr:hypothetical protein [Burkholderia sp. WAC0059]PLZ03818.1 hypothetical protein CY652_02235 [Burkholderia sp. WAC0059]
MPVGITSAQLCEKLWGVVESLQRSGKRGAEPMGVAPPRDKSLSALRRAVESLPADQAAILAQVLRKVEEFDATEKSAQLPRTLAPPGPDGQAVEADGAIMQAPGIKGPEAVLIRQAMASPDDDSSAFAFALQHGQTNAIQAFGKVLTSMEQSGHLTNDQAVSLLKAQTPSGPGLALAVLAGKAGSVREWGAIAKRLHFEGERATSFLGAVDAQSGRSMLSLAVARGHADTVLACGEVMKLLDVDNGSAKNLLRRAREEAESKPDDEVQRMLDKVARLFVDLPSEMR